MPVCTILSILVRIRASVVGRAFAAWCAISTLHEVIRCCESTLIAQLWREKIQWKSHARHALTPATTELAPFCLILCGYWAAEMMRLVSSDPEKKQLSSHDSHSNEMNCKIIRINLPSHCVHYCVCHMRWHATCCPAPSFHTLLRTKKEKLPETNVRRAISTVGIIILFTAHHIFTLR